LHADRSDRRANSDQPSGAAPGECPPGSGADRIVLAAGASYVLTQPNNVADGYNGLPPITSDVTIAGNGATIRRSAGFGPAFRLFVVLQDGGLRGEDLMLANGHANGAAGGGAILGLAADVTLVRSRLSGNESSCDGGAVSIFGGSLTVIESQFESNLSTCSGGAIYVLEGAATLRDSVLRANLAFGGGGGGMMVSGTGSAELLRVTIEDNRGILDGGGLLAHGASTRVLLVDSRILGNEIRRASGQPRGGNGGGLANGRIDNGAGLATLVDGGEMTLVATEVRGNRATRDPGVSGVGYGGGIANAGRLRVQGGSLIADNEVVAGGGGGIFALPASGTSQLFLDGVALRGNRATGFGIGGGLYTRVGAAVRDTDIAGNEAYLGGGIALLGFGAVAVASSSLHGNRAAVASALYAAGSAFTDSTLSSTTVSGNQVAADGPAGGAVEAHHPVVLTNATLVDNAGGAGGIYNNATVRIRHSIVAGNRDQAGGASDCSEAPGAIWIRANSLLGANGGCPGIGEPGMSAIPEAQLFALVLGPRSGNGHPTTSSHLPRPSSLVLDGGAQAIGNAHPVGCDVGDQLGRIRPQDDDGDGAARCDIGAIEGTADPMFADGFE
jgi:predicted outer membrane repeat protein